MVIENWFFDKLQQWVRPVDAAPQPATAPAADQAACAGTGTGTERAEPPAGPAACGWFDSSHELQQGLQVLEHDNADTVARELPLRDWLLLHLAGGGTQHGAHQGLAARWAVQVGALEGPGVA